MKIHTLATKQSKPDSLLPQNKKSKRFVALRGGPAFPILTSLHRLRNAFKGGNIVKNQTVAAISSFVAFPPGTA
ncbi:hypothetical protein O181_038959 [Austropuccinia psidii MF-1]|uniref:Uncharacterized protein n=1 Tax=Austropuccinia psidii MF-1 TaxID=1389203 RepID=A0A9Q3D9G8_9BASI|nr:hypothetical protein [Austropuccinia psidii MF-1]